MPDLHERAAIRHYVVAALSASQLVSGDTVWATSCRDRVYPNRVDPFREDDNPWPRIAVYVPDEEVDRARSSVAADPDNPGHLRRELLLDVVVVDMADQEDGLDAVALEVERVIDSDPTFGMLIDTEMQVGTKIGLVPQGARIFVAMVIHYLIAYYTPTRTPAAVPDPPIDEVFVSWAPEIGIPHKDEYVELTHTGRPKV